MYVPKYAEVTDQKFLEQFIEEHSFGTLVSNSSTGVNANHYPFICERNSEGELLLWTHLARSNPQWTEFKATADIKINGPNHALAIFTGPHAYISPTYYVNRLNVPTWSYTAVHVRGFVEVVSDENLELHLMKKLVAHFEQKNGTEWAYVLPEDFHAKLLKAIVWLKLKVISIDGKFKLSQNRDQADYDSLVSHLSNSPSDNNRELINYMKTRSRAKKS